jgi:ArsR family transcriptional regulator
MSKSNQERVVSVAKALSDPSRIEMIRFLARQDGPLCACDIVERFDLSQPTVSHHLKILKEAGLLRGTRDGLFAFYEVEPAGVAVLDSMSALLNARETT